MQEGKALGRVCIYMANVFMLWRGIWMPNIFFKTYTFKSIIGVILLYNIISKSQMDIQLWVILNYLMLCFLFKTASIFLLRNWLLNVLDVFVYCSFLLLLYAYLSVHNSNLFFELILDISLQPLQGYFKEFFWDWILCRCDFCITFFKICYKR